MRVLLGVLVFCLIAFLVGAMINTIRVKDLKAKQSVSLLDFFLLYVSRLSKYVSLLSFRFAMVGIVVSQLTSLFLFELVSFDLVFYSIIAASFVILNLHYFVDLLGGEFEHSDDPDSE